MGQKILLIFCPFFLAIFLVSALEVYSFSIKKIDLVDLGDSRLGVSVAFDSFPAQDILLALKRQKGSVLILYEFEFKTVDPFEERIIHKEVYFQQISYDPETNVYCLEDNFGVARFLKPEDLLPFITSLHSYPLILHNFYRTETSKLRLNLKVSIKFYTHLDKNLRQMNREKKRIYETSKSYVFR